MHLVKKIVFTFLFIIFWLSPFCQNFNEESDNGYNKFYYPNGQVSSEGFMINGKPDGIWKAYYVNGILKSIGVRKNAMLDSVWVFYNEKGNIKEKINYLDGKKNGYYYRFDYFKNKHDSIVGYLASEELYLNNRKNGISQYYYKNYTVKLAVNYNKGKKHGTARKYDENGILIAIIEYRYGKEVDREIINQYKNSLKNDVWKEFYPNGKIKLEQNYEFGKLHGLEKKYDLSGELINVFRYEKGILKDTTVTIDNEIDIVEKFYDLKDEEGNLIKKISGGFIKGKPIGVHRTYDSLGRVNSSRMYDSKGNLIAEGIVNEDGDKFGDWEYFYSSGNIKSKGRYKKNRRVGPWSYFYKKGNIEQNGDFIKGVPNGLWKWYFESGVLKRKEYYRLGMEDGESFEYDEKSNLVAQGCYIEGMKEGKWFYDFYFHTEKGNYKSNFKDGFWKYFYKNDKIYFEGKFTQRNCDGKHLYYYKNGKLKQVEYYIFGRKTKNWEFYDYYGTLIKILTFENNKLVKIDGVSVEIE